MFSLSNMKWAQPIFSNKSKEFNENKKGISTALKPALEIPFILFMLFCNYSYNACQSIQKCICKNHQRNNKNHTPVEYTCNTVKSRKYQHGRYKQYSHSNT